MSFLVPKSKAIDPNPTAAGIGDSSLSTNQQAIPIPYLIGEGKLPGHFISREFNGKTKTIAGGKGGAGKSTTYFASFAMLFCLGPVDELKQIIFDDETIWTGSITRSGTDYADVTINRGKYSGVMRIYWGTETQIPDPHLNDATLRDASGEDHPAYRGICYVVFYSLPLGNNRSSAPNVQLVINRYPVPSWSGSPAKIVNDTNPAYAIHELLTMNGGGAGLALNRFEEATLYDLAVTLNSEGFGLSVVINRAQSIKQFLNDICSYFDGYWRVNSAGKIEFYAMRPVSPVISISDSDFCALPSWNPGDLSRVRNKTRVVFTNKDRRYKEDMITWRDRGASQILNETSEITLQRPWITRQAVAGEVAGATGIANALPSLEIKVSVRRDLLDWNAIGQTVNVNSALFGVSYLVFRVTDQSYSSTRSPNCELTLALDRSNLNGAGYMGATDTYSDPSGILSAAPDRIKLFEMPLQLSRLARQTNGEISGRPSIAALVVRGDEFTNGFNVWLKNGSTASYVQIASDDAFAVHGTLASDYTDQTLKIDESIGFLVTINSIDNVVPSPGLDEAYSRRVVAIIGKEIVSIISAQLVSGNTWRVYCIRDLYDTPRDYHYGTEDVWIVELDKITPFTDTRFKVGQTYGIKVQPVIDDAEYALADLTEIPLVIEGRGLKGTPPSDLRRVPDATNDFGDRVVGYYKTSGAEATIRLRWENTEAAEDDFYARWNGSKPADWDSATVYADQAEVWYGGRVWVNTFPGNVNIQPGSFNPSTFTLVNQSALAWVAKSKFRSSTVFQVCQRLGSTYTSTTGASGIFTGASNPFTDGDMVYLQPADGTIYILNPGLRFGQLYYIVQSTATTWKLSLSQGGAPVTFLDTIPGLLFPITTDFLRIQKTVDIGPGANYSEFTYSNVVSWFGTSSFSDFVVRCKAKRNGLLSDSYIDIKLIQH